MLPDARRAGQGKQPRSKKVDDGSVFAEDSLFTDSDLISELDIGDKYAILMRLKAKLDESSKIYYISKQSSFVKCIPIRNAIMHGKPLTTDQYAIGFALAQEFVGSPTYWPKLNNTYRQYSENPEAIVSQSITLLDEWTENEVLHNLPTPDYDDTGFLPRSNLEKDLIKKIKGRHPVITVLGDGGNGKTALTLQTLYGLIANNDHDFEAFIWVSAKANRLTISEVERIEGAITTSLGIFEQIADTLDSSSDDPIDRVKRLLEENKILLIIDNLETVLDSSIRDFAAEVPGESKIIFTSRVPLGGDLSIQVPEFSEDEAVVFLRKVIDAYSVTSLKSEKDTQLRKYVRSLSCKPLTIKWFALGVSKGVDPRAITSNPEMALQFCMENVFERLGHRSQEIISMMAMIPQPISATIVQFISDISATEVESAVAELARFGLIESNSRSEVDRGYRLKPFVRAYLTKVMKLVEIDRARILERYKSVAGTYQSQRSAGARNRFDPRFYTVRSPSEALAASQLRRAFGLAASEDYPGAFKIISDLKITDPGYFEIYRASAFLNYNNFDSVAAQNDYEAAFELCTDQPQLHYFYGGFLMRAFNDYDGALNEFEKALAIEPSALPVAREAARVCFFRYDFEQAQKFIDMCEEGSFSSHKDKVIYFDLRAQCFLRQANYLLQLGEFRDCLSVLYELHQFLATMSPELVDDLMAAHLKKGLTTIRAAMHFPVVKDLDLLDSLERLILSFIDAHIVERWHSEPIDVERSSKDRIGYMKEAGRTENFGFIRDSFGVDTYLARTTVSVDQWRRICNGEKIMFDIASDDSRSWADNVRLV